MKVETMKMKFPDPKPADIGSKQDDYCVGGAVVMSVCGADSMKSPNNRWPSAYTVSSALIAMNPSLKRTHVTGSYGIFFAKRILSANDVDARTDLAWEIVEMALNFDPDKQHLVAPNGDPVTPGKFCRISKGKAVMVEDIIPPHKPSSTGRVILRFDDDTIGEYFPGVIGAHWINREDQ